MAKQLDISDRFLKKIVKEGLGLKLIKIWQPLTNAPKQKPVWQRKRKDNVTQTFPLVGREFSHCGSYGQLQKKTPKKTVYGTFPKVTDKHFKPTGVMVWFSVASDGSEFP